MYNRNKIKKGNKKVANATPISQDGIKYKSKLEAFCAKSFKDANIKVEYETNKFVLQEGFDFDNECYDEVKAKKKVSFGMVTPYVRPICYIPDFVDEKFRFCVELKGWKMESYKLKAKMFKKYLFDNKVKMDIYVPKNQKQVTQIIEIIKNKYK
jgi:hypothetical protein